MNLMTDRLGQNIRQVFALPEPQIFDRPVFG
jgi:hypothetical protein